MKHSFDTTQKEELKKALHKMCVHDAIIDYEELKDNRLTILLTNPYFHKQLSFTFHDLLGYKHIYSNEYGRHDTIIGLDIEDKEEDSDGVKISFSNDYIYLVFDTFSADEIHVVSKSVCIEENDKM